MCCRYWADESPENRAIVEAMNRSPILGKWQPPAKIVTFGEVRPTNVVPVIAPNRFGERAVFPMKWGYSGRSLLINARAETAAEKPTFREDWRRHRCIVPASWYFEWEHTVSETGKPRVGSKYRIRAKDSALTWMCGLYRFEGGLPVFVVLTREPAEEIRFLHDRMPMILPERFIEDWIRPDANPEDLMGETNVQMAFEEAI